MLNPLYNLTARAVVAIHSALAHVLGGSGWAWALSIVLLTMAVRLVLFPLFVKQIKAQRTMQMLQPKFKELREKYKNDKPRLNEEMLKLQREHGNPLLGCLPIVVQIPLFIALFHVLSGFAPKFAHDPYTPKALDGLTNSAASSIAHAKIFGASLSAAFTSPSSLLHYLGSNAGSTKALAVILIVIMAVSTYITQRQIFGRNGPTDPSQATQQKIMLYLSPLFLGIFGFKMPVGVLLYWFTTNFWSMGQQSIVLRRMPPLAGVPASAAGAPGGGAAAGRSLAGLFGLRGRPTAQPAAGLVTPAPRVISSVAEPRAIVPGRAGSVATSEGSANKGRPDGGDDGPERPGDGLGTPGRAAAPRPRAGAGRPPRPRSKNQRRRSR